MGCLLARPETRGDAKQAGHGLDDRGVIKDLAGEGLTAESSRRNPRRNRDRRDANTQSIECTVLRILGAAVVLRSVIRRNRGGWILMIEESAVFVIRDDPQALRTDGRISYGFVNVLYEGFAGGHGADRMLTIAVRESARRQPIIGFDEGVIDVEAVGQIVDEELLLADTKTGELPGVQAKWIDHVLDGENLGKQIIV